MSTPIVRFGSERSFRTLDTAQWIPRRREEVFPFFADANAAKTDLVASKGVRYLIDGTTSPRWVDSPGPAGGSSDALCRWLPRALRSVGRVLVVVTTGAVFPPALSGPADPPLPLPPGTHKVITDLRVSGIRRSYFVHVPAGSDGGAPLPVILALHGAFSSALGFERYSGLSRLADREGFLVVYPQGIGLGDWFRHWNSGHCCGKARKMDLDDVGFALGAVDDVALRNPVDRDRLYVVGHSNGGMLAHRIAAERPDAVAAVAVVAGTIGGTPSESEPEWIVMRPARPVPALAFHGRADEHVPYEGGRAAKSRGKNGSISVTRSIGLWTAAGDCDPAPRVELTHGGRVERRSWSGRDDGVEVILYSLAEWGHDWPGGRFIAKLPASDPLRGFDATEIIGGFFERHRRAP